MSLKVVLRMQAVEDEDAIFTYLQKQSPRAAARFQEAYQDALRAILKNPLDGHHFPGEREGLRYLRPAGFKNYFVIYRMHFTAVEVLRILHGARDFEAALGLLDS